MLTLGCAHRLAPRTARIGFMIGEGFPTLVEAFRGELHRLGYVEGRNLVLESRFGRGSDTPRHARELAALGLDVIVAGALPQALALKALAVQTPVVIATAPGIVANGLAQSMQRPGGNFTGMDELPPGLTARRLRLLTAAAPQVRKVALLSTTPGTVSHAIQLADAEGEAAKIGVAVKAYRVTIPAELEPALAAIAGDSMQGLVNFQGGLSLTLRALIIDFAKRRRLPAIYQSKLFTESGGLMALSPDQEEQYRMAARNADRIVRGAKPGDIPIVHPPRYFLSINLKAAAEIGLQVPEMLLQRADFVTR
jgi:putative ABC transport system substrate-binding protein